MSATLWPFGRSRDDSGPEPFDGHSCAHRVGLDGDRTDCPLVALGVGDGAVADADFVGELPDGEPGRFPSFAQAIPECELGDEGGSVLRGHVSKLGQAGHFGNTPRYRGRVQVRTAFASFDMYQLGAVAQAAEDLCLSRRAVLHRIQTGTRAATKVGEGRTSSYVITVEEIERAKAEAAS